MFDLPGRGPCENCSGTRNTRFTAGVSAAGAEVIGGPAVTPGNSLNSRLRAPAGVQLTLFEELGG